MRVTRRSFVRGAAAGTAGLYLGPLGAAGAQKPGIDGLKLRGRIEALSMFGRPAGGTFADGVSRVAYSDADVAARAFVMREMRASGFEPRIDPAGNIFARRAGTDASAPPILFGSHIDSVPSGGNFDGDLGSLAALGLLEACERDGIRTRHPLEMVIWAAEEGVAFGRGLASSRIVAGDVKPADMDQVWNGLRRADGIRKLGGTPDRIMEAVRPKGAHHAYVELHIEQGGTLEQASTNIGIVQGIVAIQRYRAIIKGFANHAGTTPMNERQDAMLGASHLAIAVREAVTSEPGRQVGTVGHVEIEPNAPNVIPGVARLTIELRDLSVEKLERLAAEIRRRAAAIAARTSTSIEIADLSRNPPALAEMAVQDVIERESAGLGLSSTRLPSGAGHDAQMMAQLSPMGMIFVPSIGGISHSPRELTRWDDCTRGADVLLRTVLALDR
ncbi:MAG: M20 family metallo-hydrolase [Vicinamibacterales bacterium]